MEVGFVPPVSGWAIAEFGHQLNRAVERDLEDVAVEDRGLAVAEPGLQFLGSSADPDGYLIEVGQATGMLAEMGRAASA